MYRDIDDERMERLEREIAERVASLAACEHELTSLQKGPARRRRRVLSETFQGAVFGLILGAGGAFLTKHPMVLVQLVVLGALLGSAWSLERWRRSVDS